jgi:hypothetical protein
LEGVTTLAIGGTTGFAGGAAIGATRGAIGVTGAAMGVAGEAFCVTGAAIVVTGAAARRLTGVGGATVASMPVARLSPSIPNGEAGKRPGAARPIRAAAALLWPARIG